MVALVLTQCNADATLLLMTKAETPLEDREQVSFRITPELYSKVNAAAHADHRSMSSWMRRLIAEHFDTAAE